MPDLHPDIVPVDALSAADRAAMYALMGAVYDGTDRGVFERDLAGKDVAIVLRSPAGELVGFSTQVEVVLADGQRGVFSGDTVIRPDHWGSPALMQAFSRRYIVPRPTPFWWFLVCKGHRTYRFLPTFFTTFWPTRRAPTPPDERAVMDAYAAARFGSDYNPASGVVEYRTPHDRLRAGVAGIAERELRNPDVAFFADRNPGHELGHDLVCLTDLRPANLKPRMRPILLGEAATSG